MRSAAPKAEGHEPRELADERMTMDKASDRRGSVAPHPAAADAAPAPAPKRARRHDNTRHTRTHPPRLNTTDSLRTSQQESPTAATEEKTAAGPAHDRPSGSCSSSAHPLATLSTAATSRLSPAERCLSAHLSTALSFLNTRDFTCASRCSHSFSRAASLLTAWPAIDDRALYRALCRHSTFGELDELFALDSRTLTVKLSRHGSPIPLSDSPIWRHIQQLQIRGSAVEPGRVLARELPRLAHLTALGLSYLRLEEEAMAELAAVLSLRLRAFSCSSHLLRSLDMLHCPHLTALAVFQWPHHPLPALPGLRSLRITLDWPFPTDTVYDSICLAGLRELRELDIRVHQRPVWLPMCSLQVVEDQSSDAVMLSNMGVTWKSDLSLLPVDLWTVLAELPHFEHLTCRMGPETPAEAPARPLLQLYMLAAISHSSTWRVLRVVSRQAAIGRPTIPHDPQSAQSVDIDWCQLRHWRLIHERVEERRGNFGCLLSQHGVVERWSFAFHPGPTAEHMSVTPERQPI